MNRNELINDPESAMQATLDGRQALIWTAMPGIVTAVDFATMTCTIQPAIMGVVNLSNGQTENVKMPLLLMCPITFPQAGGFILTLPLTIGDEVLVVFASRCIDGWWQGGQIVPPLEFRMHDLSDGFCIPGPCSKPNVYGSISATGAQIRNKAGTTYVEISADGKIKLVSPSEIDITGDLKVSGAIVAQGEVTGNGIPLSIHVHPGVTTGGGSTGAPVP